MRILMIVGDFNEDLEVRFPQQSMEMLGHDFHTVSSGKPAGSTVVTAVHDLADASLQSYTEARGHAFPVTHDFEKIDLADYDALVIPGGRAPEYQRCDEKILDLVRHFFKADKPVACTCHGIQILAAAGVIQGRTVTAIPFCRIEAELAGATFVDRGLDGIEVDGVLVTASTWMSNAPWMRAFNEILVGAKV
ncbi:MAG: DJ-1/PfpI family protein [Planctomycetota bacterium]|nr:DJ-1/PfpI family protein [Planctomycetota bacterium]